MPQVSTVSRGCWTKSKKQKRMRKNFDVIVEYWAEKYFDPDRNDCGR